MMSSATGTVLVAGWPELPLEKLSGGKCWSKVVLAIYSTELGSTSYDTHSIYVYLRT